MDTFYVYGLIALLAAILKIGILSQVITQNKLTSAFNLVCIGMIFQHSLEFLAYFTYSSNTPFGSKIVDGIMIANYLVIAVAMYFVVTVSEHRFAKPISLVFALGSVTIAGLHISGNLINGYTYVGYTLIPDIGQYYLAFPLLLIVAMATVAFVLYKGWQSDDSVVKSRCKLTFWAVTPVAVTGLSILVLQAVGAQISGAIIMPIMSTVFVWVMMMDERGDIVTFKIKWRILWTLATTVKNVSLRDWTDTVEKQLVLEALRSNDNNQSAAARLLGSNKTTFHRKVQRLYDDEFETALPPSTSNMKPTS